LTLLLFPLVRWFNWIFHHTLTRLPQLLCILTIQLCVFRKVLSFNFCHSPVRMMKHNTLCQMAWAISRF